MLIFSPEIRFMNYIIKISLLTTLYKIWKVIFSSYFLLENVSDEPFLAEKLYNFIRTSFKICRNADWR